MHAQAPSKKMTEVADDSSHRITYYLLWADIKREQRNWH
jgi:hypothetical protein